MNDERSFERFVADHIVELGAMPMPDDFYDDIDAYTSRHRQPPRWLALIKEPPMRTSHSLAVGSPTARVAAIMVATLLITLMVAGAGVAGNRLLAADGPIVVDQSGNGSTTTITAAVEMAEGGDTILVRPGIYDESIVLAKDVTIRGDGDREDIVVELSVETPPRASCSAPDLPTAFVFEGSDATLENLTLRGESARIIILGGAPLLRDLVLDGIGRVYALDPGSTCVPTGLDINEGSTATIMDSLMLDMDIDIESGSSPSIIGNTFSIGAIWMVGADVDPVIRENVIEDSVKWGISIGAGARPVVLDNIIVNARNGIEIEDTSSYTNDTGTDPVIRGNTIIGSQTGITLASGADATIEGNEIADSANTGIWIGDSEAIVRGNTIHDNPTGMRIAVGSPILDGNTIADNVHGLILSGGAAPVLTDNVLCGNKTHLSVPGGLETPDTEGNEISETCPDPSTDVSE